MKLKNRKTERMNIMKIIFAGIGIYVGILCGVVFGIPDIFIMAIAIVMSSALIIYVGYKKI